MLVGADGPRMPMICTSQGFGQKALVRRCIAFGHRVGSRSSRRSSPQPQGTPQGMTGIVGEGSLGWSKVPATEKWLV
jgi:hypothetical protein